MDWQNLLSTKRLGSEGTPTSPRPGRTEFESDIDRLIFSSSFRRLGRKTQVHPLAANDHIHTRLTHSLEVSRVGKALGKALGHQLSDPSISETHPLPPNIFPNDLGDVVQAACLAHDLGNPPFGHAGEEAIIHWFAQRPAVLGGQPEEILRDLTAFEGNAQGFRIITQLENHVFAGGLRLTYSTLGAFQKYPWSSRKGVKKFGAYITEEKILSGIFQHLGLKQHSDHVWCRHPLAHLVEAADDICYAIIDVEDAVELGILSFQEAKKVLLDPFSQRERDEIEQGLERDKMHRVNFARMRGRIFDKVIEGAVEGFTSRYADIMEGRYDDAILDLLPPTDPRRTVISEGKRIGRESIYADTKKVEIEIGCYSTLATLLDEFCTAAADQSRLLADAAEGPELAWKAAHVLRLLGDHAPEKGNAPPEGWTFHQCLRRAVDFVSGMTDNYAIYVAQQMRGGGFSGGQRP